MGRREAIALESRFPVVRAEKRRNARRVEDGEDPLGIIRDPAENEPWIAVPREQHPILSFRIDPAREHLTFMKDDEAKLAASRSGP